MLLESAKQIPSNHLYELKWDGVRCIALLDEKRKARMWTRTQNDITTRFPEVVGALEGLGITDTILDGELCVLLDNGRPSFKKTMSRIAKRKEIAIALAAKKNSAQLVVFDCLRWDGEDVMDQRLEDRKKYLEQIGTGNIVRIIDVFPDGKKMLKAVVANDLEGIVAKHPDSKYVPDSRSKSWVKIKNRKTTECTIVSVGKSGDKWAIGVAIGDQFRGTVELGLGQKSIDAILGALDQVSHDFNKQNWLDLEPLIRCEIDHGCLDEDGYFREPLFKRFLF